MKQLSLTFFVKRFEHDENVRLVICYELSARPTVLCLEREDARGSEKEQKGRKKRWVSGLETRYPPAASI